ncbi:hypothetical protein EOD42_16975 [Rhodovarius crocodyli]|uniref:Uncharacterized protein n=1 Tax=Rhodovarius crocodyli TaxID=1979269 RepID=A0A437MCA4_9PROT|nr:hypothetical protein [Rhodovarius crocodyli]RVT95276.1 hypothetical protein EOD42_16975 [Rhodovarius crocodyli]
MSAPDAQAAKTPAPKGGDEREARLAAALRENLRRRKAQARARADSPAPDPSQAETKPQT